jgi:iron complex outermembrane receptor protein
MSLSGRVHGTALVAFTVGVLANEHVAFAQSEDAAIEVHVHGDRGPPTARRDPSGATFVVDEDHLRAPGSSAADVLAETPGVQVARTGAASDPATASIRGATSAQIPVYLAGVRLNDDTTGGADLSLIPLWMLRRAEVYRSGAPFEADRLGPGGALFFEPVLPHGTRVGAGLQAGSFGERAAFVGASLGDERASALIALRRTQADNDYPYLDDRGTRFDATDDVTSRRANADATTYDAFSIGRARLGRASVTLIASALAREQGVTGLSVVPARAARASESRLLLALGVAVPCSASDRCRLDLQTSTLTRRSGLSDPRGELGLLAPWLATSTARLGETARVRYDVTDAITLQASLSQEAEQLYLDEPGLALLRAHRATSRVGVGAVVRASAPLTLNALVAIERHATDATAQASSDTFEPALRVGAELRANDNLTLLANAGRYARVPTLGELYGTSSVVRGNADLSSERGYFADLGARATLETSAAQLYADLFGFARVASDLIGFRRSSFGVVRPYNLASARVLGAELAVGAALFRHARLELALTLLDPRDTSDDHGVASTLLPFQARLVASPSLELFAADVGAFAIDRVALRTKIAYRASYATDPAGLVVIPAQAPIDLELSLLLLARRVAARFALEDLLDANRFDLVGLPLPRRSAHGSLEVWW